jgi:hypothetical protein
VSIFKRLRNVAKGDQIPMVSEASTNSVPADELSFDDLDEVEDEEGNGLKTIQEFIEHKKRQNQILEKMIEKIIHPKNTDNQV